MTISELIGGLLGGAAGGAVERTMERGAISKILQAPDLDAQEQALTSNIGYLSEAQAGLLTKQLNQRRDEEIGSEIALAAKEGRIPKRMPTNTLQPYTQNLQVLQKNNEEENKAHKARVVGDIVGSVMSGEKSLEEALVETPPQFQEDVVKQVDQYTKTFKDYQESRKSSIDADIAEHKRDAPEYEAIVLEKTRRGEKPTDQEWAATSGEFKRTFMENDPEKLTKEQYAKLSFDESQESLKKARERNSNYLQTKANLSEIAMLIPTLTFAGQAKDALIKKFGLPDSWRDANMQGLQTFAKEQMGGMKDVVGGRLAVAEFIYLEEAYISAGKSIGANMAIAAKIDFQAELNNEIYEAMLDISEEREAAGLGFPLDLEKQAHDRLKNNGRLDALTNTLSSRVREAMAYDYKVRPGQALVSIYRSDKKGNVKWETTSVSYEDYVEAAKKYPDQVYLIKSNLAGESRADEEGASQ